MVEKRILPPHFDTDEGYQIRQGFFLALLALCPIVFYYFGFITIEPDLATEIQAGNIWTPQFLCGIAIFALIPLVVLSAGIKGLIEGISISVQKKRWIKEAVSVQVPVVDKNEEFNVYAESREEMFECKLAIKLPGEISKGSGEQIMWIRVGEGIYDEYSQRDIARIYFSATQPDMFIIEGE